MPPDAAQTLFRAPLLRTPFHDVLMEYSTMDRFVPWAGYTTVDVFSTVEHEYFAVRNQCSVFDLTPMVKYDIAGPDAEAYLNRLVTRDVRKLKPGRVFYTVWCNDDGHVIDDGTIFRLGADRFRLCTAERQIDWLLDSAIGFDVAVTEVTAGIAALSIQGPTSCSVLRAAGCAGIETLSPFGMRELVAEGVPLTLSRTGFTGDLGYELWLDPAEAPDMLRRLLARGADWGIRPIGSQALNMVRIEAGFIMPNSEFVSAESTIRTGRARTPFELGLDWLVSFDKPHFTGKRALLARKAEGGGQVLVGLDIEGKKPAIDAWIYPDRRCRKEIGVVTAAMWSPTCKRNIALGFVPAALAKPGGVVWAELYLRQELAWERRVLEARVVERPFFAPERRRQTPAPER